MRLDPTASDTRAVSVGPSGLTDEPIRRAGLWEAKDEAGRSRGMVAVNPDADAGRTGVQDPGAVQGWALSRGLEVTVGS